MDNNHMVHRLSKWLAFMAKTVVLGFCKYSLNKFFNTVVWRVHGERSGQRQKVSPKKILEHLTVHFFRRNFEPVSKK